MNKILSPFAAFFRMEASSGILLAVCTLFALIIANSPLHEIYHQLLIWKFAGLSIHHWINDGLMVLFFFVVGMEIKRELVAGELSSLKKASLPIAAALGGMIAPALIYYFFNPQYPDVKGWGIPMATDIAFAVGVLSFFKNVPNSLKVFLLALAIVDDLGAVAVIALFYTKGISIYFLAAAVSLMGFVIIAQKLRLSTYALYTVIGVIVWLCVLRSGIHATVAGVVLGLLTPLQFNAKDKDFSPLNELIHLLHPWVSFLIMPVFALANAGVRIVGVDFGEVYVNPIFIGIFCGLLFGKPVGILFFSFISVKLGWAQLPSGVKWMQIFGLGTLGGIGFTMALFISSLALYPEQELFSKSAILAASTCAGILGSLMLWLFLKGAPRKEAPIGH